MITGNALAYFRALARCCPPHPFVPIPPALRFECRTRKYSIRHCRNRIKDGIAIMMGRRYWPPHALSGRCVAEPSFWKNMQRETKRSAMIFAYDVNTSASRISPNFPCPVCAKPPIETRFRIVRKRVRPSKDNRRKGRMNTPRSMQRYEIGRKS